MRREPIRLTDEAGAPARDADDARLARLLRSVGPLPHSEIAKRRVLVALHARADRYIRGERRPAYRVAFAAGALLLVGGIAGATVGRDAWHRLVGADAAPAAARPVSTTTSAAPLRVSPAPAAPVTAVAVAPAPQPAPPATVEAPAEPVASSPGVRGRGQQRRLAHPVAAPVSAPAPAEADNTFKDIEISEAAVREYKAGQPDRALAHAAEYLARNPEGTFREPMYRVVFWAARSTRNPKAIELAQQYRVRFPGGRLVKEAEAVITLLD